MVSAWGVALEARGLGGISINVRITAAHKLAAEAADNGPVPTWVKVAIDSWAAAASITDGRVFRRVNRADEALAMGLSEKVVWQLLQQYATTAGVPGIAPHDLRRTCAKLCRAAGGELEQIQLLLGHASVQTTERYLGTKQDLVHAPNDSIKLHVS